MEIKNKVGYITLLIILIYLLIVHVFRLYELLVDKFTFFLVTLIFILLVLPSVSYIKGFDLVEIKKKLKKK